MTKRIVNEGEVIGEESDITGLEPELFRDSICTFEKIVVNSPKDSS